MRKKLLIVIPNLGLGGAQRAFHDHSVELQKRYDVTEAVFNLDEPNIYPSGNPLENMDVAGGGSALRKAANFAKRITRLRALKNRLQADVCVSHLEGADYVNLLSKGREKVILLIQGSKVHDRNISGPLGWLRKKVMMPALYKRADRIVTVSRDIMPEIIEAFGVDARKVLTIHNSFEVERVWAQAQEALSAEMRAVYDAAPALVTSARLAVQKNQAPLLDIFADLLRRRPAKLIFIGDGELRNELISKARALGLRVYDVWAQKPLTPDYDVYFIGLQQNPFKFIHPADLFVFPSGWEGFPLALGEAMICGAAVVTTDCPTGPREMLAPATATPAAPIRAAEWAEFGILMPMLTEADTLKTDEKVWTDTIEQLLADPAERQRLGQLARRRMEDFTHKKIFQRWSELIEEVLAI
ncbi:glycosyltransferase [Hymenobacter caeli]|uniref:Glycosyltransferase involved in cell wall biosynthesis n=1 Tax=Hymenobacter caeli TaxID=2735894 RepID=A0ABX2FKB7_9BACT|nr:glycosyltransferase [Hymenobacter caeli]NRT17283.1 glycosyltransferase involved in cell wall biosynthesis [Hymenobacter caeli]